MKQKRIHSIDAVRALALLGILLVHTHDFCNLSGPKTPPPGLLDGICDFIYGNMLVTRAFMVFSFLFGLSFFLQIDRAAARGERFLGRFCWRLTLLFLFGVAHSFFYCGDILMIFSITGLLLVLMWRLPNWLVATLAGICLLQPLALYHAWSGTPGVLMDWFQDMWRMLGCTGAPNHQTASFWEIGVWNLRCGVFSSFLFTIYSYRIWDILGMFMLGLLAGRFRLFEGPRQRLWKVAGVSFIIWAAVVAFRLSPAAEGLNDATNMWEKAAFVSVLTPLTAWVLDGAKRAQAALAGLICGSAFVASLALNAPEGFVAYLAQNGGCILVSLAVWCMLLQLAPFFVTPLTRIGRCTLTCYIMQSVVMTWLLSGYGLNLRPTLSVTGVAGIALALYAAQVLFCMVWLRIFHYGPLEGLWRRLTRLGMKPTISAH